MCELEDSIVKLILKAAHGHKTWRQMEEKKRKYKERNWGPITHDGENKEMAKKQYMKKAWLENFKIWLKKKHGLSVNEHTECEQEKHKRIIMKFSYRTEKQIGATEKKRKEKKTYYYKGMTTNWQHNVSLATTDAKRQWINGLQVARRLTVNNIRCTLWDFCPRTREMKRKTCFATLRSVQRKLPKGVFQQEKWIRGERVACQRQFWAKNLIKIFQ